MSEENVSPEVTNDTGGEPTNEPAAEASTVLTDAPKEAKDQGAEGGEQAKKEGEGEAKKDDGPPEAYKFTAPEGVEVDQALVDAVSPVFKELNLNQEQASKLNDAYADVVKAQAEQSQQAFTKQMDDWKTELKNDQTFGGDNFAKNSGKVTEFLHATVPGELKDDVVSFFETTGAGNHPGLVKYFYHLANTFPVGEDRPSSGQPPTQQLSREEILYPNG